MKIKPNQYLFLNNNGIWAFQIFIPEYVRHLFNGKRVYRKSTGEREIVKAREYRDHMLAQFQEMKIILKPDTTQARIQKDIRALHELLERNVNKPVYATMPVIKPEINITLSKISKEYQTAYSERRKFTTLSKSALAVNQFLKHLGIPDIALIDIKRTQVSGFIMESNKSKSSQTIQNYLSSLSALYDYARRHYDDLPPDSPFKGYNLEAKSTVKSYQPFTETELSLLIDSAEEELRDVILIASYSGMRIDEICSLRCTDILRISTALSFDISKSKTKSGIRTVPIHGKLEGIIERHLARGEEYLLPTANKIFRIDEKKSPYYSQAFTRLRNKVLPHATDRQCFHSLRGMFITQLDRSGVPEQRIAEIVGHTRGKTESRKTYSQGALQEELRGHVSQVAYESINLRNWLK